MVDLPAPEVPVALLTAVGLIVFGYLEMHYRFRFFPFSRYFKREPEILADAPHRLVPGRKLPLTILVKDAHRFPITLRKIGFTLIDDRDQQRIGEKNYSQVLSSAWFEDIVEIDTGDLSGQIRIMVDFLYEIDGRVKTARNHNVSTSPAFPLVTRLADDPLPGSDDYFWGDLHYHSAYTEDFVEYGAPLKATKATAAALGLDFVAITDHSYDLDDKLGSWSENDPDLRKWHQSRREIAEINTSPGPVLLPAEEVTVRNTKGKNVHFLIFNHPDFIPGSGDSAEQWLHTRSEHSITEVLSILDKNALAIAAHPFMISPFLQTLLLNRGRWESADLQLPGLTGLQVINGYLNPDMIDSWVTILLTGKRCFIYAGNDAHGNFNHFHQIRIPMLTTHYRRDQILGQWRTGVLRNSEPQLENILSQLTLGRCIVTNGPAVTQTAQSADHEFQTGDNLSAKKFELALECHSSPEFGALKQVMIYQGIIGTESEKIIHTKTWTEELYLDKLILTNQPAPKSGYIRTELTTTTGRICLTNPIWFSI
ncbi:MAG: CehA/McbA family metallohydrolase [Candidatus Marinimicrobia bacterium]|nr:CehA/McbA family metallohydrolase [Candidatus Neomarinimicrobiota bacterium]